jgi:hypothetical protein
MIPPHGLQLHQRPGLPLSDPSPSATDTSSCLTARSTTSADPPFVAIVVTVSGPGDSGHHRRGLRFSFLDVLCLHRCRLCDVGSGSPSPRAHGHCSLSPFASELGCSLTSPPLVTPSCWSPDPDLPLPDPVGACSSSEEGASSRGLCPSRHATGASIEVEL